MWSKIGMVTADKMPPKPQRPSQLAQYKRIRPLDQSKQKQERRLSRSSHNLSKSKNSDDSRNSSQSSRAFSKKPSMDQFPKSNLSFKDECLSPIPKLQAVVSEKDNMFDLLVKQIPLESKIKQKVSEPLEIIQLIKKHQNIVTELQAKLSQSLNKNGLFRQALLKTQQQMQDLKKTVNQILTQLKSMIEEIPRLIVTIQNSLKNPPKPSRRASSQSHLQIFHQNTIPSERSIKRSQLKTPQKSPSQMMESILKTIGEVRMEIVGQKNTNTHHKKDSDFWTRESKS